MPFQVIPGFSSFRVNSKGEVMNERGMVLRDHNDNGYRKISLKGDDGVRRGVNVHRLVVLAHLGPIPKGMWVNHLNGVRTDNRLSNLEVVTPSDNHIHARDVLKRKYIRGSEMGRSKLTEEGVEAVRLLSGMGWSQRKLASAFGVSQPCVSNILNELSWKP